MAHVVPTVPVTPAAAPMSPADGSPGRKNLLIAAAVVGGLTLLLASILATVLLRDDEPAATTPTTAPEVSDPGKEGKVEITAPAQGSSITTADPLVIGALVTKFPDLTKVEVLVNGESKVSAVDDKGPLVVGALPAGQHTVMLKATGEGTDAIASLPLVITVSDPTVPSAAVTTPAVRQGTCGPLCWHTREETMYRPTPARTSAPDPKIPGGQRIQVQCWLQGGYTNLSNTIWFREQYGRYVATALLTDAGFDRPDPDLTGIPQC